MSGMKKGFNAPDLPVGYRQLVPVEYLEAGDMVFGVFDQTWHPIKSGSINVGTSAGNTRISVRKF